MHLYLYTFVPGTAGATLVSANQGVCADRWRDLDMPSSSSVQQIGAITGGDWVAEAIVGIDQARNLM
jgi:hypothetical protein